MLVQLAAVLLVAVAAAGCERVPAESASAADPGLNSGIVHTNSGPVRGQVAPGYVLFQGIPYAAAPVGPLRWQPPQPVAPWDELRDASQAGPRCVQNAAFDLAGGRNVAEDCLSVNVWSPTGADARPVLVWIHGGGFGNGSGNVVNADWLVTKGDIVVVTLNYRLGALGFLAHPALGDGNYGLADQQAALRWVRDNIAAFGGDPKKVTVGGDSAGAMSVCDHLVAPASTGLFRAAIIQSGPCGAQSDLAHARTVSLDYAKSVGCGEVRAAADCLRALPADRLDEPPVYFDIGADGLTGPVSGTPALPVDPVGALDAKAPGVGAGARVPVLIGVTRDEYRTFAALEFLRTNRVPGIGEYPVELTQTFGADAAAIAQRYPPQRYGDSVPLAYSAAVTDGIFSCVTDRMAKGLAAHAPVYAYEFNDGTAPAPDPLRRAPFPLGASHALDMRYLFDIGGAPALNAEQRRLSDQMIGYWSSFVRDGAPRGPGLPDWPTVDSDTVGAWLSLQLDGSRVDTSYAAEHQCTFWESLRK